MSIKRIAIVLLSICLFCGTAFAVINTPVVTALNASTYTAISIPKTNNPACRAVSFYVDDGTAFLLAVDASGTGEATIPADTSISMDCVNDTGGIIFYVKASAGTPNLVVLWQAKQ
jgi:hypothetical protein